jgi:hypothetical protein
VRLLQRASGSERDGGARHVETGAPDMHPAVLALSNVGWREERAPTRKKRREEGGDG